MRQTMRADDNQMPDGLMGGEEGLARHDTSMKWALLIARTFGHGHRAVCGGGHFKVVDEHVLADSLSIIASANRANTKSAGECK